MSNTAEHIDTLVSCALAHLKALGCKPSLGRVVYQALRTEGLDHATSLLHQQKCNPHLPLGSTLRDEAFTKISMALRQQRGD